MERVDGKLSVEDQKKCLLVMGCPQVPVQTPAVIYMSYQLRKSGFEPVIAGTAAADMLIRYSDPENYYISQLKNLDSEIAKIAEKTVDYDLCFVFIHNDAGVAYAATMNEILENEVIPVIFGKESEDLKSGINFTSKIIAAEAVHNPKPLINEINRVMRWDV